MHHVRCRLLLPRRLRRRDASRSGVLAEPGETQRAAALNEQLPPERQINEQTLQKFIRIMDVDGSGEVRPRAPRAT